MAGKPVASAYALHFTKRFVKDFKRVGKHPEYEREDMESLLQDFIVCKPLPDHYDEHPLQDRRVSWAGYLSADLSPDLRVIFKRRPGIVTLHRIAGHAQLYRWAKPD